METPYVDQEWAWGIIDLESHIPIMYHLEIKKHDYIVALLKKHIIPGLILYSDQHANYVKLRGGLSKLAQYGIYHFWVNHTAFMYHEKFIFVNTREIEYCWARLKRLTTSCHRKKNKTINENLDAFTFRCIYRKDGLH